jgi:UDP-GlcNAc:undecaprenyl-phosphate GlcNAc-1-phosphate transferase
MEALDLQILFFTALLASLALTPLFAKLAVRLGVVDYPAHRKIHKHVVPYFGGLGVLGAVVVSLALVFVAHHKDASLLVRPAVMKALCILIGTLGVALVGAIDDARNLRARSKFLGQFFFVGLFCIFGFRFEVLHIPGLPPMYLSFFAVPVTMFWMLAIVNAFNLVDGMDGLAGAVIGGSLLTLGAAASAVGNPLGLGLAVCGLGAVVGFLFFNWKPAKVYLGDAGSSGLGMFLASSIVALGQTYGVHYYNPHQENLLGQPFVYQIVIATLLVAYPAMEITLTVLRRIAHGRPISRADRGHIHHRLVKAGLGARAIAVIALFGNIVPGIAVYEIITGNKGRAIWMLMGFAVLVGIGLSVLGFFDFLKPKVMERLTPHFQIVNHFIEMQRAKLSLARTRQEVLALVNQTCQEFGVQNYRIILMPDEKGKGGLDCTSQKKEQLALPVLLDFMHPISREQSAKFKDRVKLSDGKGGAHWVFEPHEGEEELDVEYRVLFSEFMKEALETAARIGEHKDTIELTGVASMQSPAMSGHELRKRQRNEPGVDL